MSQFEHWSINSVAHRSVHARVSFDHLAAHVHVRTYTLVLLSGAMHQHAQHLPRKRLYTRRGNRSHPNKAGTNAGTIRSSERIVFRKRQVAIAKEKDLLPDLVDVLAPRTAVHRFFLQSSSCVNETFVSLLILIRRVLIYLMQARVSTTKGTRECRSFRSFKELTVTGFDTPSFPEVL